MTVLIHSATIVTGNTGRDVLYDAAIVIDNDRVLSIGPTAEVLPQYPNAETVDGKGKVVFPGLINAHTHLLATADRGILEDFGFPTRLQFPESTRSMLSPDEKNVFGLLGTIEAIRSGTTTMLEISNGIPDYVESLDSTGVRFALAENINDIDDAKQRDNKYEFLDSKRDARVGHSIDLIEKWHGRSNGRITCFVALHAPELCSPEIIQQSRQIADKYDVGYTIHLSQSHLEVEAVMRTRGVMPTHYLYFNDLLGPRMVAAHCRYVNDSEIALLGQTGCSVSNNAAIAARRGSAAPVKELAAAGCDIGMGSDNMAEDMIEVMRAGLFLERVRRNDEEDPQPEDVLEWATMGSARSMGMDSEIGSLEVGKKADLFIIDAMKAHLVPTLRIVSAFVHQGQPADVTDVMVDGSWVMRAGKVLTIDEADIIRQAEQMGHDLWNRLVDKYPNVPFPVTLPPRPAE